MGDDSFPLKHKILNAVMLIMSFYLFITSFINFYIEENPVIIFSSFVLTFILFLGYYFTRVRKNFGISYAVAVIAILALPVYHKFDGGISCGTGFYVVVEAMIFASLFKGKVRTIFLSLLGILSVFFVLIEIINPLYVVEISRKTCFVNNVTAFVLTGITAILFSLISINTFELYANEQEKLALEDPLTGLLNRRAIRFELKHHLQILLRRKIPFCLVMVDIDDFKKINDTYGHNCGDKVLILVSDLLKKSVKTGDLIGRWGGEEFLLILTFSTQQEGFMVAERLRKKIEELKINCGTNEFSITATFGLSEFDPNMNIRQNIERVDRAMYEGKTTGKNKVVVAPFN
ncbi:GGDEF domain-containing protein [Thermotomaculum hydrothermale]|nr:GGDEF domain-containing protein [Thermotomaculum hydrothermale]